MDLPPPDGPANSSHSPSGTVKSISRSAGTRQRVGIAHALQLDHVRELAGRQIGRPAASSPCACSEVKWENVTVSR